MTFSKTIMNAGANGCQVAFFSVLIASYNRPEYIKKCLDSIFESDFQGFEVIVSDDKSPRADEVEDVIEPYLETGKVKFFKQPSNLGEPANRNFLVAQASGAYNIILGDDDELFPDSLSRIKVFIENNPGYDLYGLGYRVIDGAGAHLYSRRVPKPLEISVEKPELINEVLVSDMFPFWLYHPAIFCCRNDVERDIPYSSKAGIGDDFLFVHDFFNKEKRMIIIPEVLLSWRKIQDHGSVRQTNQSAQNIANLMARSKIYYLLQNRDDLHPVLAMVTRGAEFRRRFLFDPIARDRTMTEEKIGDLGLQEEHKAELLLYLKQSGRHLRHQRAAERAIRFVSLFGIAGLIEIVRVLSHRIAYSIRSLVS